MTYHAGLSVAPGDVHGVVFELPGCIMNARSIDEAVVLLPIVVGEHLAWLSAHGEAVDAGDIGVEIVEQVDPAAGDVADGEFCFADDLRPMTDTDIEYGIRIMGYAHADLLALVAWLPDVLLDWRPPPSAMARIDEWQPGRQRALLIALLRALPQLDRGRVFRRRMPWQESGEEHWTARKVVRRVISHERFHIAEIRQRLSWALVGVPEFTRA
jgi:hypothetical protein